MGFTVIRHMQLLAIPSPAQWGLVCGAVAKLFYLIRAAKQNTLVFVLVSKAD